MNTPPQADDPASTSRLAVRAPDGTEIQTVALTGDRLSIGRLPGFNDVALQPDPQQLVTRQVHCLLERSGSGWCVVDNASVNGTFLRRGPELERVQGRATVADGDVICLLAALSEDGEATYWQLEFTDPLRTRPVRTPVVSACLEYDFVQAKLFLVDGPERRLLSVRPQVHKLARYMVGRNVANAGAPVLCDHDELMNAVWGDEPLHTREDLTRLVWELRRELEPYGAQELVENQRGLGYRLHTC